MPKTKDPHQVEIDRLNKSWSATVERERLRVQDLQDKIDDLMGRVPLRKSDLLDVLRDKLRIEASVDRGSFGHGEYLTIKLKFEDEEISSDRVSLPEIQAQV